MPKITAWKSDHTGEVFFTHAAYRKHLRQIVAMWRAKSPTGVSARFAFRAKLREAGRTSSTLREVLVFYRDNFQLLVRMNIFPFDPDGRPIQMNEQMWLTNLRWKSAEQTLSKESGWYGRVEFSAEIDEYLLSMIFNSNSGLMVSDLVRDIRNHSIILGTIVILDRYFPNVAFNARMLGTLHNANGVVHR